VRAMTATTRLAEFVVKTSLRECPDAVLAQTRRAVLDTIGVMLAGAAEPVAQSVRAVARIEGGVGLCTVLGTSMRTSPGWAALANGAAGHAHDFDDTNFALMGHPSVPLFAAALAAAEAETADGAALALAYVIGFEVDAALDLRARHHLDPAKVAAVEIGVNAVVPDVLRHTRPSNGLERKFSMQYCAAAALARGGVGLADFDEGPVRDAATRDLMDRITMVVDPALPHDLEQHAWTRVRMRLTDGTTLESKPRGASGHPATPLSDAELHAKFLGCAAPVLGADAAAGVAEQIRRLEDVPDVRALTSRLVAEQE